jgi:4-hydroxybenzoate polyprenyltransferase
VARVDADPAAFRAKQRQLHALVTAVRPRQWLKNLLLFAGLVFAAKIGDETRDLHALFIFAVYCAMSSAAYLVNDLFDIEADHNHPVKRDRPIASGALRPAVAWVAAVVLAVVALAGATSLGISSVAYLLGFLALQLSYSVFLKHIVVLDVATISGLFVIRAAAGARAINVSISGWLLACTALLSLFIALNKRRGELAASGGEPRPSRRVLEGYDLGVLDGVVLTLGAVTIAGYTAYTVTDGRPSLMPLTAVFVIIGIFRYLYLVRSKNEGEEPDRLLVTDPPLLGVTFLWALTAAMLFAFR